MNTWFTSDLHLGHANVIKYCNRPFADVEEMDRTIIDNWNSRVRPGDQVYIVGDVSFHRDVETTKKLLQKMNGQKFLIRGNHDRKLTEGEFCPHYFGWIKDLYTAKVGQQRIVLCHYAMRVWDKSHYGSYHLFGHSHGTLPEDPHSRSFDVGVDCHGYYPISFEAVVSIMSRKAWRPIDHHGN